MGAMAPYFSVYPLPAKVPINAAILASQHMSWTVTVLDGNTPVEVHLEPFATQSGPGAAFAIRPAHGWPADRSLEVVARLHDVERRHPFETSTSSHEVPPSCVWVGPSTIDPKSSTPEPDSWPTNIPRPPKHQRTFSMPEVHSPVGYMVKAQLWMKDRSRVWCVEVGLMPAASPSPPGGPSPRVTLTPYGDEEFSDAAQVIGMQLTDLAGNVSRYGTIG